MAVVEGCFKRTDRTFAKAAEGLSGDEALHAMGKAYVELIRDPVNLLVQMHCFTASAGDLGIRLVARRGMRRVWETAARASGASDQALRNWVAIGDVLQHGRRPWHRRTRQEPLG